MKMLNVKKLCTGFRPVLSGVILIMIAISAGVFFTTCTSNLQESPRERISLNQGWKFFKYDSFAVADELVYDVRPDIHDNRDFRPADEKPTEAEEVSSAKQTLKAWIMPTGNDFIADPGKKYKRPEGNPGEDFPFIQYAFDDGDWADINLPHDWAIKGPFYEGWGAEVGGGMGRLPSHGVAWYRKKLKIPAADKGKSIFLDIDGAMSYAMVWINGKLAGGWPYGYASWRVDLTPYLEPGGENQLAIRIDNPNHSSRWYPGGGIYRNVWLTKTHPVHVGQWGTYITTPEISASRAKVIIETTIDNDTEQTAEIELTTEIFALDEKGSIVGNAVAATATKHLSLDPGKTKVVGRATVNNPKLWGPKPQQAPNMYAAITILREGTKTIDSYRTDFGIRDLRFDPDKGVFVNGEHIYLKGVNQHHDLGALGAAFNLRAAERQLEILREMGCNAIRIAHNPPATELLELTDHMGFLVIDEIHDCWERKKTPHDFHLIFPDWYEQDQRAFMRRDRNHPSVIMWSLGNEVGEQYTGEAGADLAKKLHEIAVEEDSTRPTTISMNFAKPHMPLPAVMDVINLNYQGEGIRDAPAYKGMQGITTPPLYPAFHDSFPGKLIISSENAAALSSRGEYLFPVFEGISAPVRDGSGGNPETNHVSSYELYTAPFGSSADKVFRSLEMHPYVGGGFVWSGWDYLGEPTPYYLARSSYFGVIDLAGFKKDRFYLYQAHWRPELPMVHILPHWNWPDRVGQITPVHVFTSGDEAELFINGKSMGRKQKGEYEYRIRWDDVVYEPGEVRVVAYKNGEKWAENMVSTTEAPAAISMKADRNDIIADGTDLSFITVEITDRNGLLVPDADLDVKFSIEGPGEIIATDNGDPTDMTPFPSAERKTFNGLALVIVRTLPGKPGTIMVSADCEGLEGGSVKLVASN